MEGYGIDPFAPDMPYVTCTLLYRKLVSPFEFLYWPIWLVIREGIKSTYKFVVGAEFPWHMLTQEEVYAMWRQKRAARNSMPRGAFEAAMKDDEEFKVLKDVIWKLASWGRGSSAQTGAVGSATKLGHIEEIGVLGQDEVL
jgi:hypothetical protein